MSAQSTSGGPRIVAGVDGSSSSRAALRWAVRQARLTGGTVDAVIAWRIPLVLQSSGWAPIYVEEERDFRAEASKKIHTVIGEEVERQDRERVRILLVNDQPAHALLAAAEDADLLVVGSRGHGPFAEAMLGSVGRYCVHHAHCPVLIIRGAPGQAARAA
jgi:nucleotide-binding universal stress UspA family protein